MIAGSYEQCPESLTEPGSWSESNVPVASGDIADDKLREHLADAMTEAVTKPRHRTTHRGKICTCSTVKPQVRKK